MWSLVAGLGILLSLTAYSQNVVVVSIDGLRPDYVLHADKWGLKIPHLRRLLKSGAHATAVTGVLPTLTYPSHTTLMTGVSPAKHGIPFNVPFDPFGKNQKGWYWYASDIQVPTLWSSVKKSGGITASVDWPVTVGADFTYLIPQFWRTSGPVTDGGKLARALSTPGLLEELEEKLGPYPAGYQYTLADDRKRANFSVEILKRKKPKLHLAYLSSLDEEQHAVGPHHPQVYAVLEQIDEMIGDIWAATEGVFCVVSDHGFAKVEKEIHVNAALRQAGLLKTDKAGNLKDWKAIAWPADGSAAVYLKDPKLADQVESVLRKIKGIEITREGFPGAGFLLSTASGTAFGREFLGAVARKRKPNGEHGYAPSNPDMDAAFFLAGESIPAGKDLGRIDMRDVAPTLARLLDVDLTSAEGRDILRL